MVVTTAALASPRPLAPTPYPDVDERVDRVAANKDAWQKVSIPNRIAYLERCIEKVLAVAERWVTGGCHMKGIDPNSPLAGEEWIVGPWATVRNLRLLARALDQNGAPRAPRMRMGPGDRRIAEVFPSTLQERLLFMGFRAEVWIQPGKPASQGAIYRSPYDGPGKVALVLGGGNVSSIPAMDVLYKLFVENEVAVLKVNPVNDFIGPILEEAFRPLVEDGYLAIVHGGAEIGAHLANHPKIDTLHVTGSDRTYDAIVWGPPEERTPRKRDGRRMNTRPFSAELGCVTPILVVPGPWSHADIRYQARQIAGVVAQNASFNCNAGKVLVLSKNWLQKDAFLREVRAALARTPPRKAYYPGAEQRWRAFLDAYPQSEIVGETGEGIVPWTFIPEVPPKAGEHALVTEAFCGVLAETALDASDPSDFLEKATDLANETIWGTLSVTMLVHPSTMRDHREAVARAIERLRFGAIGVNCWSALGYALVSTTWGAYPGHTPEDIQSGVGVVHNAFLFDHPEKSIIHAPWHIRPTPVWFPDHPNLAEVGRAMTELEAHPSMSGFLRVVRAAI